jgi:hypothetical protein
MRIRIHNAGVYCCIINYALSWYQVKSGLPGTEVPIFWASERPAAAAVGGVGEGATRGGIMRLPHRRQETQGLPSVTTILRLITTRQRYTEITHDPLLCSVTHGKLFTIHRETLTQYITFKRGGRGESVLLLLT